MKKSSKKICGRTVDEAIKLLDTFSHHWQGGSKNLKVSESDSQNDIDNIYDIMIDFAICFANGDLTDSEVTKIEPYYKAWYGHSITTEET